MMPPHPSEGYPPRYKRDFCDAFPVRMRFAGWDEQACLLAGEYMHNVADVYTGNAWRNFAKDCTEWLVKTKPADALRMNCTLILPNFPRRSGIPLARPLLKETYR